jgi:hypothetical protein
LAAIIEALKNKGIPILAVSITFTYGKKFFT